MLLLLEGVGTRTDPCRFHRVTLLLLLPLELLPLPLLQQLLLLLLVILDLELPELVHLAVPLSLLQQLLLLLGLLLPLLLLQEQQPLLVLMKLSMPSPSPDAYRTWNERREEEKKEWSEHGIFNGRVNKFSTVRPRLASMPSIVTKRRYHSASARIVPLKSIYRYGW